MHNNSLFKILSLTIAIIFYLKIHQSLNCRSIKKFPDLINCKSAPQIMLQPLNSTESIFCKIILSTFCNPDNTQDQTSCSLLLNSTLSVNRIPVSTRFGLGKTVKNIMQANCAIKHSTFSSKRNEFNRVTGWM